MVVSTQPFAGICWQQFNKVTRSIKLNTLGKYPPEKLFKRLHKNMNASIHINTKKMPHTQPGGQMQGIKRFYLLAAGAVVRAVLSHWVYRYAIPADRLVWDHSATSRFGTRYTAAAVRMARANWIHCP